MAKRQLNKNLVGFLAAGGIFVAVVVVAIAALNASRRDPEAIASRAAAKEQNGDLEDAVRLYKSAYREKSEAKYLIEAARVERERGQIGEMFGLLNLAHTQSPRDATVLTALLERYWEMRQYQIGQWNDVLDRARSLLELEGHEGDLLALTSSADALDRLKTNEPSYAEEAETAFAKAAEIDATNPYVALVSAEHERRQAFEEARLALSSDGQAAAEEILKSARTKQIALLTPALEAHPEDVGVRIALADALAANDDRDAARACIADGLALNPDDVELHFAMAGVLTAITGSSFEEAPPEQIQQLVEEGLTHAERTIALEPALYMAYMRKVELMQLGWAKDGSLESSPGECQRTVLETYSNALDQTVGLTTIRAVLGRGERLQLIANAFNSALTAYHSSQDDDARSRALTYMKRFMQEGQTQFTQHALTPLMEGHVALVDGDDGLAIMSFRKAIEQAEKRPDSMAFGQLAKEQLVRLYNRLGQLGLASQYASELLAFYDSVGRQAPLWLWLNQADVLIRLQRPQEALDLIEAIGARYPGDESLLALRAGALALLDRGAEAEKLLLTSESDDPRMLMRRAQVYLIEEDYAAAADLLEKTLKIVPEDGRAIRMYLDVLSTAGRGDEALAYTREALKTVSDEEVRRILQTYEVMLAESDPEKRKELLLKVIEEVPDEFDRANEYFRFWTANNELERAAPYLDTMEKLKPDDAKLKQLQLEVALRLSQCERAEKYVTILAQLNADQVGGATFRGSYELSCGDVETALSEFRAAERDRPNDVYLKVRIGQTLLSMNPPRYAEAIQPLNAAVEYDPRNFPAHRMLYMCYESLGRNEQGIEHLKAAAALNPNDEFIKQRKQLLDEELNPLAGIEAREEQRAKNPEDAGNLLRLAYLYQKAGDNEHAAERMRAAVDLDPSNLGAVRAGAAFFAKTGDRAAGEALLKAYRDTQNGEGEVWARVLGGQFYEQLGDATSAAEAYQQACDVATALPGDDPKERRRANAISAGELAEFLQRAGRAEEMIAAYRKVLDNLEPDNLAGIQGARLSIVRGYMALGRFGEAHDEIDNYRKEFPNDFSGMRTEAELLMTQPNRKLGEALTLLTRVLEAYPTNPWARFMRGRVNMTLGHYTLARDDLLEAKKVLPEGFDLRHRLALVGIYEITDRPELAENELREMLKIDRNDRLIEKELIKHLTRTEQYEKIQEFVAEMIAAHPDEPLWRYQLGLSLYERGEYSAAVRPLREAIKMILEQKATPHPDMCIQLIRSLVLANRAAEALRVYDEELGPAAASPRVMAAAAEACLADNQRDLAIGLIEQAVSAASLQRNGALQAVVGWSATDDALGRDTTLEILRRVMANPPNAQSELAIKTTLALYFSSSGSAEERAESDQLLDAVLAAAKPGEPAHIDALLAKAQILDAAKKDQEQVVAAYEEVIKQSPDNVQALNNLAYRLADTLDRPAEALPYAERLQDLAPNHPNILDTVGWVQLKNGMAEEAAATLQNAVRLGPDNVAAHYHLGLVYVDQGQPTAARQTLRRALELATEQNDQQNKQKIQDALEKVR